MFTNKSFKSVFGKQLTVLPKDRQMMQTIDVRCTMNCHSVLVNFFSVHKNDTTVELNFRKTSTFFMPFVLGLKKWINVHLEHDDGWPFVFIDAWSIWFCQQWWGQNSYIIPRIFILFSWSNWISFQLFLNQCSWSKHPHEPIFEAASVNSVILRRW